MKPHEAEEARRRLQEHDRLQVALSDAKFTLEYLTEDMPEMPLGISPFTSDTRESRRVRSVTINFSRTQGGASECDMRLDHLHIDAHALGKFLEAELRKRIDLLTAEMEKI